MKVGIFGGTFNPVHNGHINLAGCYKESLGLDKIVMIPTSTPPHKLAADLAGDQARLDMLHMALQGLSGFELSDLELKRQGKSYTYDTLVAYHEAHPGDDLYLIVGSDMFLSFHEWYRYKDMLHMAVLCTAARREDDSLAVMKNYAKQVLHLGDGQCIISCFPVVLAASTDIRRRLKEDCSIRGLVPGRVEQYIYEAGLYFPDAISQYKGLLHYRLSEKRAHHCICVANSAQALAQQYGEDAGQAYLAGLLHDIMREEKPSRQLQLLEQTGIILTELEQKAVSLYHAMSGAVYCRTVLGISDEAVLNAIRYHTTGRARMSLLEKILFVADIISEDRNYPDVQITRQKAGQSLDSALLYGLEFTVKNLTSIGVPVHPDTLEAYEFIKSEAINERT